jgi:hypothetical protein
MTASGKRSRKTAWDGPKDRQDGLILGSRGEWKNRADFTVNQARGSKVTSEMMCLP